MSPMTWLAGPECPGQSFQLEGRKTRQDRTGGFGALGYVLGLGLCVISNKKETPEKRKKKIVPIFAEQSANSCSSPSSF